MSNADGKVEASEDAKSNKVDGEKDESGSSGSSRRLIAQPDKRHYIPKAAPKKIYSKRASVVKVLYKFMRYYKSIFDGFLGKTYKNANLLRSNGHESMQCLR